jgi:uncharacterized protein (TIGR02996 family)
MHDDSPYLRAICRDPFDDGPRLVWADCLDERGDPRGEFVRVQCELARLPHYETCLEACAPPDFEGCPNRMLRRREWELAFRCAAWAGTDGVVKALGADHVRRLGLSMGFTDLEFSLGGRPVALGEFRRGFVGSVTLTCKEFFGGPCEPCGGSGYVLDEEAAAYNEQVGRHPMVPPALPCPACRDPGTGRSTGRTEGVAAALFRAAPITEVRLSDREPRSRSNGRAVGAGRCAWWYTDPDWHRPGARRHWLPVELRPHLTGRISEPVDEPRPGVCGFDYGDSFAGTDGVGLARADLSAACVALGRDRAELPALAQPVSADAPR